MKKVAVLFSILFLLLSSFTFAHELDGYYAIKSNGFDDNEERYTISAVDSTGNIYADFDANYPAFRSAIDDYQLPWELAGYIPYYESRQYYKPLFAYIKFDDNTECDISSVCILQQELEYGDTFDGIVYEGNYRICRAKTDSTINENHILAYSNYGYSELAMSNSVVIMKSTPVYDNNLENIIDIETSVTQGYQSYDGYTIPDDTLVAIDSQDKIRYVFIPETPKMYELKYALVTDGSHVNHTIELSNGDVSDSVSDNSLEYAKGDLVGYIELNGIILVKEIFSTESLDDFDLLIVDEPNPDEEDEDYIPIINDFDLPLDSDDIDYDNYKNYNVFTATVKKNSDGTIEIKSIVQEFEKGYSGLHVDPYDRILVRGDTIAMIVFKSFDENQVISNGIITVGTPGENSYTFGQVAVTSLSVYSNDNVEIELMANNQVYTFNVIDCDRYNFTDMFVGNSYTDVVIRNNTLYDLKPLPGGIVSGFPTNKIVYAGGSVSFDINNTTYYMADDTADFDYNDYIRFTYTYDDNQVIYNNGRYSMMVYSDPIYVSSISYIEGIIPENALVIKYGSSWDTRDMIEVGDICTKVDLGQGSYYLVSDRAWNLTFDSAETTSIEWEGATYDQYSIVTDLDTYTINPSTFIAREGANNATSISLNKLITSEDYNENNIVAYLDYNGNLVRIHFGEIEHSKGDYFALLSNKNYGDYIGIGLSNSSNVAGEIPYDLNATLPSLLLGEDEYYNVVDHPLFIWKNSADDSIVILSDGLTNGDVVEETTYNGKYDIVSVDAGSYVDGHYIMINGEYNSMAKSTKIFEATYRYNDLFPGVVGVDLLVSTGYESYDKCIIPEGTLAALDSTGKVRYLFIPGLIQSSDSIYALVTGGTYAKGTIELSNGVTSDNVYDGSVEYAIGDLVVYTETDGLIIVKEVFDVEGLDDSFLLIVNEPDEDEDDEEIIPILNGNDLSLDPDDEDYKTHKNYNVFTATIKKYSDGTIEIKSIAQESTKGHAGIQTDSYDRIYIDDDNMAMLLFKSFDEDQVIVNGCIEVGTPGSNPSGDPGNGDEPVSGDPASSGDIDEPSYMVDYTINEAVITSLKATDSAYRILATLSKVVDEAVYTYDLYIDSNFIPANQMHRLYVGKKLLNIEVGDNTIYSCGYNQEHAEGFPKEKTVYPNGSISFTIDGETYYMEDDTAQFSYNDYIRFEYDDAHRVYKNQGIYSLQVISPSYYYANSISSIMLHIPENTPVIIDGETWGDVDSVSVGSICTCIDLDEGYYYLVSTNQSESTFNIAYSSEETWEGNNFYIYYATIDNNPYQINDTYFVARKGENNATAVGLNSLCTTQGAYTNKDVVVFYDFFGNPVRVHFGDIDTSLGHYFAILSNNLYSDGYGIGLNSESNEMGEMVYDLDATLPAILKSSSNYFTTSDTPLFAWKSNSDNSLVILSDGLSNGDIVEGATYNGSYDIVAVDAGTVVDGNKIMIGGEEHNMVSSIVVFKSTPVYDDTRENIISIESEATTGYADLDYYTIPEGTLAGLDSLGRVKYLFIPEMTESSYNIYALVTGGNSAQHTIELSNGVTSDNVSNSSVVYTRGDLVVYTDTNGLITVKEVFDVEGLDDSFLLIVNEPGEDEDDEEIIPILNGNGLSLDPDDEDYKTHKNYNVFTATIKKNSDDTIEIRNIVKESAKGHAGLDVDPFDRIYIDDENMAMIVFKSFDEDQVIVNGCIEVGTPGVLPGDLDENNGLNIIDVRLLLQTVINSSWTAEDLAVMDLNKDNEVNIIDVRLLLQMVINNS